METLGLIMTLGIFFGLPMAFCLDEFARSWSATK
tara:strand:- start:590 stop:691 length:102 start_codon:yes stop_codon:yes gene_type:complete